MSLLPLLAVTGTVTASATARHRSSFSSSVRVDPSPVVALNRAVALGMRDGPAAGLAAIEALLSEGALGDYHLAHAARYRDSHEIR